MRSIAWRQDGFNPHPARRPGATFGPCRPAAPGGFQSSPGPKTGCHYAAVPASKRQRAFQSSPGPKTGCHIQIALGTDKLNLVSILTRPEDRVPPQNEGDVPQEAWFQSSPGPKTGCHMI